MIRLNIQLHPETYQGILTILGQQKAEGRKGVSIASIIREALHEAFEIDPGPEIKRGGYRG